LRNFNAISREEQEKLKRSHVLVAGCGGLGGYVISYLARLGVGRITAFDPDEFAEHNLNRQIFADMSTINRTKVEVVKENLSLINPEVKFTGIKARFEEGFEEVWENDIKVVVDALDSIPSRLELARICKEKEVPLVYGMVGGWYGEIGTQFPEDETLENLCRMGVKGQGVEKEGGVLSFVVGGIAALQAAEVVKVILGRGEILREKVIFFDFLEAESEIMELF